MQWSALNEFFQDQHLHIKTADYSFRWSFRNSNTCGMCHAVIVADYECIKSIAGIKLLLSCSGAAAGVSCGFSPSFSSSNSISYFFPVRSEIAREIIKIRTIFSWINWIPRSSYFASRGRMILFDWTSLICNGLIQALIAALETSCSCSSLT